MKRATIRYPFFIALLAGVLFVSCSKNKNNQSQLQVRLVDNPATNVKEVWVDIQQVEITGNSGGPVVLGGIHPGVYNLLALTNGKDTLLADATIPEGKISQVRLILGDNNYIIKNSGEKVALQTPSAMQSGLKVQIHEDVSGGTLYRLTLDFDVARSIVQAGDSTNLILKPVLRILSFAPSGGNIRGVVTPLSVRTAVIVLKGTDTVATTFTDITNGNYFIKDVPAGNYSLSFIPTDLTYKPTQLSASVVLGQTTVADTARLLP